MLETSQQIIFTAAYNAQVTKNCGSVCLLKMTALVILVKFFTATALWTALKIALIWQQSAKRTTFPWKPIFLLVQWEKLFDSESLEIPWWWFHDVCQTVRRDPRHIFNLSRQTVNKGGIIAEVVRLNSILDPEGPTRPKNELGLNLVY